MPEAIHSVRRAQLEEERDRLRAQLAEFGGQGADGSLSFDEGFADSSQVTAERSEMDALAGRLTEALREVDDALTKVENGTYGKCESCGKEIGEARLDAMPAARLCIACASKSR
jgi:DnaK suppressor protein